MALGLHTIDFDFHGKGNEQDLLNYICANYRVTSDGDIFYTVPGPRRSLDKPAGARGSYPYKQMKIRGKIYMQAKIAWMLHWRRVVPSGLKVIHISDDVTDNSKTNLLCCTKGTERTLDWNRRSVT